MHFDARAAKQLAPGQSIVYEDPKGLRLVATEAKRSWIYRFKSPLDGKMRQVKIGEWPAVPWAAAVAKWQELKNLRDSGTDPALTKKERRRAVAAEHLERTTTVLKVVETYAKNYLANNREPKGARAVESRLRNAVAGFASEPAASVTRKMVFDLMSDLSDRPVLAKSVKTELAAAWDLALDAEMLPSETPNWWRQVKGPKLKSKGAKRDGIHKGTAKRVLSDEEVGILLREDLALLSENARDVMLMYLWTCCRGAEIVQINKAQIREEASGWWWNFPKHLGKNRHRSAAVDLRVPLFGGALEVVQRRLKTASQAGYLFPSEGRLPHITQNSIQSQTNFRQAYSPLKPEVKRTRFQVNNWSPHDLRRTGRTMLAAMGCPAEIAEAILGHVQPGIVGTYNLYQYDTEKRHWLGKLSEKLEALRA
ncbi:tyrosine-type recombinase/integrase [Curvibacter sp. HBC61]|uniref:Tyrosine-type recombinase/integrase n=1 Tax=Curvibacter cyanobacteriorum TaxID=3026422 RepID=A0ABT5MUY3_9BURK|nr:integrase arm-type DNA-binding domain-containing protein [Curvibacter sp. HBC61]MDD0837854.1 tyrosine-type recombinase/integrase [Curvibacter sp. HBC61]